jgi:membrane protease YdiL (CAAX protease family)
MSVGLEMRRFWRALAAFATSVVLAWTIGAILQFRHGVFGLALTELVCFALPAGVALWFEYRSARREIHLAERFAGHPFRRPTGKAAVLSALIGALVVVVAVAKGAAIRQALGAALPRPLSPGLVLFVLAGIAPLSEELLFRAVLQRSLAAVWSQGTAVSATALLFALTHGTLVQLPETFVLGLFSGVVFLKTRSYWASVLFHAAANALAPTLWGLVPRFPPLFHPVTALALTGGALFLAWHFELPRTERVWGVMKHVRWALFGAAAETQAAGPAPKVAALVYWGGVLGLLGIILGLRFAELAAVRLASAMIQVKQEDVWRLDPGHTITALSRVYYARWPGRRESASLALPYTEARVVKVEIGGQPASFRPIGAGTFELAWPKRLPETPRVIEVIWTVPLDALEDAAHGYQARLQALVPVTGYALTLRLAPGCGYVFERAPERAVTELFSILDTGTQPRKGFGTCGIGLRAADTRPRPGA